MTTSLFEGTVKVNYVLGGGGVTIAVAILIAKLLPGSTMPTWVVALIGFLLLWALTGALAAVGIAVRGAKQLHAVASQERAQREAERERYEREHGKPVVQAAVKPYAPYEGARCVFIVRWPTMTVLPLGAPVIISTVAGNHERPLGGGAVRPPQQDGMTVVTLDSPYANTEDFIRDLLDPAKHEGAVKQVRIGPGYDLQNLRPAPPLSPAASQEPPTMTQPGQADR